MRHLFSILRLLAALGMALALVGVVAAAAPHASASAPLFQDNGDDGDDEDDDDDEEGGAAPIATVAVVYPALIHPGTCDTEDPEPAFPLTSVTPHGEGDDVGGIFASDTEIAIAVSDLLAEPHAITVLASEDDLAATLACGAATGQVVAGKLIVGLRAANNGDLLGIAVLTDEDEDGESTVEIYLILSGIGGAVDDDRDDNDDAFDGDGDGDGDGGDGDGV